ncbi:MAG: hypothetical protein HY974_03075 [Candidatus Kerfeldbacteria bacterium]|nr:hypothetical protein [Candidatus Kerfeldbacteria bacterium]
MAAQPGFDFGDSQEDNMLAPELRRRSAAEVDDLLRSLSLDQGDPYYVDVRGELLLGTPLAELLDVYTDKASDEDVPPLKEKLDKIVEWLNETIAETV